MRSACRLTRHQLSRRLSTGFVGNRLGGGVVKETDMIAEDAERFASIADVVVETSRNRKGLPFDVGRPFCLVYRD